MRINDIGEDENLGRGVFESKFARKKTSHALANFYRRSLSPGSMSVDRLDIADLDMLCDIHDSEATRRTDVQRFYGWQTFTANLAFSSRLSVTHKPTKDNDWHAVVCLPEGEFGDEDALLTHCNELASETIWFPRPLFSQVQQEIEDVTSGLDF